MNKNKQEQHMSLHDEFTALLERLYAVEYNEVKPTEALLNDLGRDALLLADRYFEVGYYFTIVRMLNRMARSDYPYLVKVDIERKAREAFRKYEENIGLGYDRLLVVMNEKITSLVERLWNEEPFYYEG